MNLKLGLMLIDTVFQLESMGTIFAAGGIVMWPLLGFSILAIALVVERLLFWVRINRRQRPVMQDILRTYRQAPMDVYPKLRQNVNLPLTRIFSKRWTLKRPALSSFTWRWPAPHRPNCPTCDGLTPFLPPSSASLRC
jgi:biopolymer transport protein ExbB/TolQ